ncbi:hypothetical protein HNO89_002792 [Sporosarcina luteola]|nr:hypothetical protein [Sporosarcina luteola]
MARHSIFLAVNSIIWRSCGLSGVPIKILAFTQIIWRSDKNTGVHADYLAFQ